MDEDILLRGGSGERTTIHLIPIQVPRFHSHRKIVMISLAMPKAQSKLTKLAVRLPLYGLIGSLILIALELFDQIGPYVRYIIPCTDKITNSAPCSVTYDFCWMVFLVLATGSCAFLLAVQYAGPKRKQ